MKEVIDVGLPPLKQPISWAVKSAGMLFTAHGPVRSDGSIDTGPVEDQARLTFANLRRAGEAAGGDMHDVTQVLIYMTDVADMPAPVAVDSCGGSVHLTGPAEWQARIGKIAVVAGV